jgi:hypothetical protein
MMTRVSRRELTKAVRERYWRADTMEKRKIRDEFVANTGYHRLLLQVIRATIDRLLKPARRALALHGRGTT